jgi:hypothetical protein
MISLDMRGSGSLCGFSIGIIEYYNTINRKIQYNLTKNE